MDYPVMSADEKKWQAESDARTLAESEVIRGDEARMKAAQEAAASLAEDKQKELDGLRAISSVKYPKMEVKRGE